MAIDPTYLLSRAAAMLRKMRNFYEEGVDPSDVKEVSLHEEASAVLAECSAQVPAESPERARKIDALVADWRVSIAEDPSTIEHILRNGFVGYANLSDADLDSDYREMLCSDESDPEDATPSNAP